MSDIYKTLVGCSLIHFCIGSIYANSVLYKSIIDITNWSSSFLIGNFSLVIFVLGITASFHQKYFSGLFKKSILVYSSFIWSVVQVVMIASVFYSNSILYIIFNFLLGLTVGLLYVIPINLIAELKSSKTGFYSGVVISCFGLGSLVSAKIYSIMSYDQLIYLVGVYYLILLVAMKLINSESKIENSGMFKKDINWYLLSVIYFFNIGIGISILSNLVNLSLNQGVILSVAITLTAISGLANTLGRLVYSFLSDYIGKINSVILIMSIQFIALLFADKYWYESVLLIISVYGGFFALIPGIMKEIYQGNSKVAYSQILAIWGISGFISPILFNCLGNDLRLLLAMSSITLIIALTLRKRIA